jgi:uncharacterized RDD family membrane protein YckC
MEQRAAALMLDCLIMFGGVFGFSLLVMLFGISGPMLSTLIAMFSFLVATFYFIWFELAWQGRTPGKKSLGLRVVKRDGGELTGASIVARNLTRDVELFLPMTLMIAAMVTQRPANALAMLMVITTLILLPFFSKKRLRLGDYLGGTMVVSMPKRALAPDLARAAPEKPPYVFTDEQLGVYGNLELEALETLLRDAEMAVPAQRRTAIMAMELAAEKIQRKINWPWAPPRGDEYRFLKAFYLAERDKLEKGLILGRRKESKLDTPESPPKAPSKPS